MSVYLPLQSLWKEDKNIEQIKLMSKQKQIQDKKLQILKWEIVNVDDSESSNGFDIMKNFRFSH